MARTRFPFLNLEPPEHKRELNEWLGMTDVNQFLTDTSHGKILVHFQDRENLSSAFLASVLIPKRQMKGANVEDLLDWNLLPSEGEWGYTPSSSRRYRLTRPFEGQRARILQNAVPLYTMRTNPCVEEDRRYYAEINPQVTQVHDLHWVDERSAYCTLDEAGNICELVQTKLVTGFTLIVHQKLVDELFLAWRS